MKRRDIVQLLGRPDQVPAAAGVLPTGSVSLDTLLGGGWPVHAVSELAGPPGYADPLAYRTLAAVQAAHPDRAAVFCSASFSAGLARKYCVDQSRLLLASTAQQAVSAAGKHDPCIAVIDQPLGAGTVIRADKSLSMLYLTVHPGDVRSAACIRLSAYGGARGWAWAERMWHSGPARPRWACLPACLRGDAFLQEVLDIAVLLGIVTVRGRWYSCGPRRLGGGWEAAVHALQDDPQLVPEILASIAVLAPSYHGWCRSYS